MARNVTVKAGETLLSIADANGFSDWQYVWNANADLKEKRPDPNVLAPGDTLTVPDPRAKEVTKPTNEVHKFRMKRAFALVDLVLRDDHGYKMKNVKYEIRISDDEIYTGMSNSEGRICIGLPPMTKEGILTVWPWSDDPEGSFAWHISVGKLNPVVDKQGNSIGDLAAVQARLNNLGFNCGAESGSMNDTTKDAIRDFQISVGHENPSGELDEETLRLLESMHNSL